MRIGIGVDREGFTSDLLPLVRSFFPDADVTFFASGAEESEGLPYDLTVSLNATEDERGSARDRIKRELYQILSEKTGKTLPWGTLTGVRPTKLIYRETQKGRSKEEIRKELKESFFVSDEKIALATEVAGLEKDLLRFAERGYSLYIGIPFCPSVCAYCTFSSSRYDSEKERIGEYLNALRTELAAIRKIAEGRLHTIYIGGGTPSALSEKEIEELLTMIEDLFPTEDVLEYTFEAGRPDTITKEKLGIVSSHAVDRISINPQTMKEETLRKIGRSHTVKEIRDAYALARECGFENINMDLILGLPDEDEGDVLRSVEEVCAMSPESITVHSLAYKRASRFFQEMGLSGLRFGNEAEQMDQVYALLKQHSYHPYYLYRQKNMRGNLENVGFAKRGKESLYNCLIMEEIETIYAAGAGATSKFVGRNGAIKRVIAPKDITTYLAAVPALNEKKRTAQAECTETWNKADTSSTTI